MTSGAPASCCDPAHPLNGIDFVEFRREPPGNRFVLDVTFLKTPPAALPRHREFQRHRRYPHRRPPGLGGRDGRPTEPVDAARARRSRGRLLASTSCRSIHPPIDPERIEAVFSFKAACPSEFDCRQRPTARRQLRDEPALDYLAKDYQSFRRLMVDLIAERNPSLAGTAARRSRHDRRRAARLCRRLSQLLSGRRTGHRGLSRHLPAPDLGAAPRPAHRSTAWTTAATPSPSSHFRAAAGTDGVVPAATKLIDPHRPAAGRRSGGSRRHRRRRRRLRRRSRTGGRRGVRNDGAHPRCRHPQRAAHPHLGRRRLLSGPRRARGLPVRRADDRRRSQRLPTGVAGRRLPAARRGAQPAHRPRRRRRSEAPAGGAPDRSRGQRRSCLPRRSPAAR